MPFAKRGDVVHSEATSGFNNQKKSLLINGLAALGDSLHPLQRPARASANAKPAPARRVDLEDIARLHLGAADVAQLLHPPIGAPHAVDAHRTRRAAGHAEGAVHAAVAEDARGHGLQEAQPPHAAVAAAPAARAA